MILPTIVIIHHWTISPWVVTFVHLRPNLPNLRWCFANCREKTSMNPKNSSNLLQTQKKVRHFEEPGLGSSTQSSPNTSPALRHLRLSVARCSCCSQERRWLPGPWGWRDARWPRSPPLTTQEVGENPTKNGGKHGKRLQSRRPITFFQVISMNRSDQLETLSFKHCSRSDLLKSWHSMAAMAVQHPQIAEHLTLH